MIEYKQRNEILMDYIRKVEQITAEPAEFSQRKYRFARDFDICAVFDQTHLNIELETYFPIVGIILCKKKFPFVAENFETPKQVWEFIDIHMREVAKMLLQKFTEELKHKPPVQYPEKDELIWRLQQDKLPPNRIYALKWVELPTEFKEYHNVKYPEL